MKIKVALVVQDDRVGSRVKVDRRYDTAVEELGINYDWHVGNELGYALQSLGKDIRLPEVLAQAIVVALDERSADEIETTDPQELRLIRAAHAVLRHLDKVRAKRNAEGAE